MQFHMHCLIKWGFENFLNIQLQSTESKNEFNFKVILNLSMTGYVLDIIFISIVKPLNSYISFDCARTQVFEMSMYRICYQKEICFQFRGTASKTHST